MTVDVYFRNDKLERKCREKRLTGALVTFNTGIPSWKFSKIMNGRERPTHSEAVKISELLECPVNEIFSEVI